MYSMVLMMAMGTSPEAANCHPAPAGCNGCNATVVYAAPVYAGCNGGCNGCQGGGHKLFGGGLFGGHKNKGNGCGGCYGGCTSVVTYAPCAPVYVAPAPCAPVCAPACPTTCAAPAKKCGLFGGGLFGGCKKQAACAPAPVACDPCTTSYAAPVYGAPVMNPAPAVAPNPMPVPAPAVMPKAAPVPRQGWLSNIGL